MLSYNDLKIGAIFVYEGAPYEVIAFSFLRMQQRKPVAQTQIKNLITGKILDRNFHMNESFEEAEIDRLPAKYLYENRGQYWFCEVKNPSKRFSLTEEAAGLPAKFTKQNTEVSAMMWNEKVINIVWPIKADLKVTETPPGEKGNSAGNTTKSATLETGAIVQVPMFVNAGDIIRLNTSSGAYVERVEKSASTF